MPMGTSWALGSWDDNAWADGTWADRPIGLPVSLGRRRADDPTPILSAATGGRSDAIAPGASGRRSGA